MTQKLDGVPPHLSRACLDRNLTEAHAPTALDDACRPGGNLQVAYTRHAPAAPDEAVDGEARVPHGPGPAHPYPLPLLLLHVAEKTGHVLHLAVELLHAVG